MIFSLKLVLIAFLLIPSFLAKESLRVKIEKGLKKKGAELVKEIIESEIDDRIHKPLKEKFGIDLVNKKSGLNRFGQFFESGWNDFIGKVERMTSIIPNH